MYNEFLKHIQAVGETRTEQTIQNKVTELDQRYVVKGADHHPLL